MRKSTKEKMWLYIAVGATLLQCLGIATGYVKFPFVTIKPNVQKEQLVTMYCGNKEISGTIVNDVYSSQGNIQIKTDDGMAYGSLTNCLLITKI